MTTERCPGCGAERDAERSEHWALYRCGGGVRYRDDLFLPGWTCVHRQADQYAMALAKGCGA